MSQQANTWRLSVCILLFAALFGVYEVLTANASAVPAALPIIADDVRCELTESRRVLAEKLGRAVPYLAWPGGHYNEAMIQLAKESGYVALFTQFM